MGFDDLIAAREADVEYLRDWIKEIENGNWKSVRRVEDGSTDVTDETHAWARQQLAAAEDQIGWLRKNKAGA